MPAASVTAVVPVSCAPPVPAMKRIVSPASGAPAASSALTCTVVPSVVLTAPVCPLPARIATDATGGLPPVSAGAVPPPLLLLQAEVSTANASGATSKSGRARTGEITADNLRRAGRGGGTTEYRAGGPVL